MSDATEQVARISVFDPECISRRVLEHATGRWGALVLAALVDRPLRFTELRAEVAGVADRMLSQTLQRLQADGLVSRTPDATVPPRVDYDLTAIGRPIAVAVCDLIDAIYRQVPAIVTTVRAGPTPPRAQAR